MSVYPPLVIQIAPNVYCLNEEGIRKCLEAISECKKFLTDSRAHIDIKFVNTSIDTVDIQITSR